MKWCNIKEMPYCSRERTPAHCTRLCRNSSLILYLIFPQLRWQADTLLKVIWAVLPVPLEPRRLPGHIPKCTCCSGAKAETCPLGCHVVVSMEMRRKAGRDSGSHLSGQRLRISEEPSLPNSNLVQVVISPNSRPKPIHSLSLCCLL